MNYTLEEAVIAEHRVTVIRDENQNCNLILYCHCSSDEARKVYEMLDSPRPILAAIENNDWNAELSPWYADKVFRGGDSFAGKADDYLSLLITKIIPECENICGTENSTVRCITGYSMAGMFAAYCAYKCSLFCGVVSASGSLWFDGFAGYCCDTQMSRVPCAAYFSVGLNEKNSRNPRMARVEDCMRSVAAVFAERGAETLTEYNEGGHFCEPEKRLARGINYVTQKLTIQEKITWQKQ